MRQETKELAYTISFGAFAWILWLAIAIGSVALTTGCGGGEGDVNVNYVEAPESCVPGHMTQCPCENGEIGYQTCSEDGKSYGECNCPTVTTPGQDAGAEASTDTDAEAEASTGQDAAPEAATEAGTDAEAGGEAATDANDGPLVSYTFKGPAMEQYADPGDQEIILLLFDIEAHAQIEIRRMPVYFIAAPGNILFNSGTQYLQNLKVMDLDTNQTLMGPRELPEMIGPNGENSNLVERCVIEFNDGFTMNPGDIRHVGIQVRLSDTEVQEGDFFGGKYTAELWFNQGDVYDMNANTEVPLSLVEHPVQMLGEWTNIVLPFNNQLEVQLAADTPATDIAVTNLSDAVPFTYYNVINPMNSSISFDRIGLNALKTTGYGAQSSINCLYGVIKDVWLSTCDIDPIGVSDVIVDAPATSVELEAGEQATLKVYARLNQVQPSSVTGDLPRSGDAVRIELQHISMDTDTLYLATSMYGMPEPGNHMILRKSKPIVTPHQLPDNVLASGYRELYRMQIGSHAAGPVAIKQFMLDIEKTSGVMLGYLRVFEGSVALPMDQYTITGTQFGTNVRDGTLPADTATVAVTFASEVSVSGAGKVYSVYGQVLLSGSNNHVTVQPHGNTIPAGTGYLMNSVAFDVPGEFTWIMSPSVYHVGETVGWTAPGDFLWSDLSESPHSPELQSNGGSRDWTNGYLISDLGLLASLSQ